MHEQNGLLFDENPIVVNPKLASIVGLNEAIVLQQIHYWLNINEKADRNFIDGRYWTYNTFEQWHEQFPFWSVRTIKRTFAKLKDMGLVVQRNYNKMNLDRTAWYTIDYTALDAISRKCQNDTMHSAKMTPPIPETTITENSKKGFPAENERVYKGFAGAVKKEYEAVRAEQDYPYSLVDVLAVFDLFFKAYEQHRGEPHPRIKRTQLREMIKALPYSDDVRTGAASIEPEDYPHLIEAYFRSTFKNCDYRLPHFLSGNVRQLKYYETCY